MKTSYLLKIRKKRKKTQSSFLVYSSDFNIFLLNIYKKKIPINPCT